MRISFLKNGTLNVVKVKSVFAVTKHPKPCQPYK